MRAREGSGSAIGLALGAMILGAMPALPQTAWAQTAPVYTIPRAATPVRVDGILDEEAWKSALVLELAYEIDPGENTPAPVQTECLLTYDSAGLHAAPQTLIFVGYSETRDNENAVDLEQRDRTLFVKFGYAWIL